MMPIFKGRVPKDQKKTQDQRFAQRQAKLSTTKQSNTQTPWGKKK